MTKGKPAEENELMGQTEQLKGNWAGRTRETVVMRRKTGSCRNRRWQQGKGISLTMKGAR